jgi:hypothetical protein
MLSIYGHRKLVITQLKYVRQADGGKKKKKDRIIGGTWPNMMEYWDEKKIYNS